MKALSRGSKKTTLPCMTWRCAVCAPSEAPKTTIITHGRGVLSTLKLWRLHRYEAVLLWSTFLQVL